LRLCPFDAPFGSRFCFIEPHGLVFFKAIASKNRIIPTSFIVAAQQSLVKMMKYGKLPVSACRIKPWNLIAIMAGGGRSQ
jgi:hypothetical protein